MTSVTWPNRRMRRQSALSKKRLQDGWGRARASLGGAWPPAALFANGEPGFVLPVDPQFLFQNAAGTIPVTTSGDPVGLRLDVSRMQGKSLAAFLARQPELKGLAFVQENGTPPNPINYDPLTGEGNYSREDSSNNGGVRFFAADIPIGGYWVDAECLPGSTGQLTVRNGLSLTAGSAFYVDPGTRISGFVMVVTGGISFSGRSNGDAGSFIVHSVKALPGNHFIQTTDAARPAYQIDGNGKACVVYDGSDDFMVSAANVDFTGTDEMLVCAGVHKASDAALGLIVDLSINGSNNNGAFYLAASTANTNRYQWNSRGSANSLATGYGYAAPISNVLTGLGDIGNDTSVLRVDGVQAGSSSTDQGTGNYGNYPVYLGRRGGTTLPFNGRDYGLTVLGRLPTDAELARVEAYYAKASGVTL